MMRETKRRDTSRKSPSKPHDVCDRDSCKASVALKTQSPPRLVIKGGNRRVEKLPKKALAGMKRKKEGGFTETRDKPGKTKSVMGRKGRLNEQYSCNKRENGNKLSAKGVAGTKRQAGRR